VTDLPLITGGGIWLVEPDHPELKRPEADRINEPWRPDRLAWNTFHTLAEWNTDVWIPSLLEQACGADNPISRLEWADASVSFWPTDLDRRDAVEVLLEGRDAIVVVEATIDETRAGDDLVVGAERAVELAGSARQAAFVFVVPPGNGMADRLDDLKTAELLGPEGVPGHGLRPEALARVTGTITWSELGALALDLAEEGDPLRSEQVHQLVTQLQEKFPDVMF
jgi:hypothetical protein